ncbi:MAG TPA: AAA family ATPase, partial [Bacteroidetes bacterium]|nr:AAA family ATPase [Bacteroidota bacterium]
MTRFFSLFYVYLYINYPNMQILIGRNKEIKTIKEFYDSPKSEFIVVYGRRRVGKTFLVRQIFNNNFAFQLTGIANVDKRRQLMNFHAELVKYNKTGLDLIPAKNWFSAFQNLIIILEANKSNKKKVIFLDELPWLANGTEFVPALEHFWNSMAVIRDD